jgi:hypothetical protein
MIFNGGKTRLDGNIDFNDFSVLLQNYYENKTKMSGTDLGNKAQIKTILTNDLNLVDEQMLDRIIENLFRVLTNDIFQPDGVSDDSQGNVIRP